MDVQLSSLAVGDRFRFPYDRQERVYVVKENNPTCLTVQCQRATSTANAFNYYWDRNSSVTYIPAPEPAPEPKTEFRFSDLEFDYSENDESIQIRVYEDRADGQTAQRFTIDLPPAKAARLIEELSNRLARIL